MEATFGRLLERLKLRYLIALAKLVIVVVSASAVFCELFSFIVRGVFSPSLKDAWRCRAMNLSMVSKLKKKETNFIVFASDCLEYGAITSAL